MGAPETPTRKFVVGLPKAELHVHLEGTLEPALKLALAERNGVEIGQRTIAEVEATYQFDSLTSFLAVYYPAMEVLVEEQDFYELARAYLQRAVATACATSRCSSTRRRTRPAACRSRPW